MVSIIILLGLLKRNVPFKCDDVFESFFRCIKHYSDQWNCRYSINQNDNQALLKKVVFIQYMTRIVKKVLFLNAESF